MAVIVGRVRPMFSYIRQQGAFLKKLANILCMPSGLAPAVPDLYG
jgi:hypothetical protein